MAASGYTPISLYYSTTASAVPTSGNLANGELGLNIADMKLYAKNSSGVVTLLASNGSTGATVSSVAVSGGTTGLTTSGGPITTSGTITLAGTLAVANGGTGSTSLTAGRILFGAGTSALGNSANLFWDSGNNRLGIGTTSPSGAIDVTGRSYFRASGSDAVLTLFNTSGGDGSITATGTSTTMNYVFNTYSTASALCILNDGNVGIGTSSPDQALVVNRASNSTYLKISGPNNTSFDLGLFFTDGTNQSYFGQLRGSLSGTAGALATITGGAIRTVLDSSGNLGIGTTSPASFGRFAVSGTTALINNSILRFYNSGNSNWSVIDNPATDGTAPLRFQTGAGEVARFINSGALSFGSTGTAYGSSGQVLTSAGAGGVPTWETAGGGTTMLFAAFSSTMGL